MGFRTHVSKAQVRLRVPSYSPYVAERFVDMLPVVAPHELINDEALKDDGLQARIRDAVHFDELPDSYKKHPVVQLINAHLVDYPTPSNLTLF